MSRSSTEQVLQHALLSAQSYDEISPDLSVLTGDSCCYRLEGNLLTIAFKGSHSAEQWIMNLLSPTRMFAGKEDSKDIAAFESSSNRRIVEALIGMVLSKVGHVNPSRLEYVVCGHSRGGLLAATAGLYHLDAGRKLRAVYTYGAPKLYSEYNAHKSSNLNHLKAVMVSVWHKSDPVPKSLDVIALNYHLGECTYPATTVKLENVVQSGGYDKHIKGKKKKKKAQNSEETSSATTDTSGAASAWSYLAGVVSDAVSALAAPHSIRDAYIMGLQELLENQQESLKPSHLQQQPLAGASTAANSIPVAVPINPDGSYSASTAGLNGKSDGALYSEPSAPPLPPPSFPDEDVGTNAAVAANNGSNGRQQSNRSNNRNSQTDDGIAPSLKLLGTAAMIGFKAWQNSGKKANST